MSEGDAASEGGAVSGVRRAGWGSRLWSTLALAVAALVAALVAGLVLWVGSLAAVAQYAEDICFEDLDEHPGYGGYRTETRLWPPRYDCVLGGRGVEPVYAAHGEIALARLVATVGLPVGYGGVAVAGLVWWWRHDGGRSSDGAR